MGTECECVKCTKPDYEIVGIDEYRFIVNGVVFRWDDYNYHDPDFDRQMAMEAVNSIKRWGDKSYFRIGLNLGFDALLFTKPKFLSNECDPLTAREITEMLVEVYRAEDKLSIPGDFL